VICARGSGKQERDVGERPGLTLTSGGDLAVLRVSSRVFDKFKAALGEHNVKVSEGK
jgi:hypothetical protein